MNKCNKRAGRMCLVWKSRSLPRAGRIWKAFDPPWSPWEDPPPVAWTRSANEKRGADGYWGNPPPGAEGLSSGGPFAPLGKRMAAGVLGGVDDVATASVSPSLKAIDPTGLFLFKL